jgi:hypothetical protein
VVVPALLQYTKGYLTSLTLYNAIVEGRKPGCPHD